MINQQKKLNPLHVILPIVVILTLGLYGLDSPEEVFKILKAFVLKNKYVLIFSFVLSFLGSYSLLTIVSVYLLKKGQGTKINDFTDSESRKTAVQVIKLFIKNILLFSPIMIVSLAWKFRPFLIDNIIVAKIVIGLVYVIFTASLVTVFKIRFIKEKKNVRNTVKNKLPFPKLKPHEIALGWVGEDNESVDETDLLGPQLLTMVKKAFLGNMLIFGAIGTGKTSAIAKVLFRQILKVYKKSCVFVGDAKGSFYEELKSVLLEENRTVHVFGPESKFRYNPIYHPNLLKKGRYVKVASNIKYASLSVLGSSDKSLFWENSAYSLLKSGLVLLAMKGQYFTLRDLRTQIANIGEETSLEIQNILDEYEFDEEELTNIQAAKVNIEEYAGFGNDLRTSILASTTVFLQYFDEYSVAKIFCPKEHEINLESMDQLLNEGHVIISSFEDRDSAKGLGTFVKVLYQDAIEQRFKRTKRTPDDPYFFFGDEFQDLATSADADTTAKFREYGYIHICLSQSLSSLYSSLKDEYKVNELLGNFRTKITLQTTDKATIEHFQFIAGQYEKSRVTEGYSENTHSAEKNYMDGGYESGKININQSYSKTDALENHLPANKITRLDDNVGYGIIYQGKKTTFHKIFFKPDYLDKHLSHYQIMNEVS